MSKKITERTFITEHTLELRHAPTGKFLDERGALADYIKANNFFQHWQIQENTISFFDGEKGIQTKGAIVSYKNLAFLTYNPSSQNYFKEQALSFWKNLLKYKNYTIPEINRFGVRTRCFIPSKLAFQEINNIIYMMFFNENLAKTIGGKQKDLQITLDLKELDYDVRVILGPVQKGEANRYFNFTTSEFIDSGLYLDIDYFQNKNISHDEIQKLFNKTMELTWIKMEHIANAIKI